MPDNRKDPATLNDEAPAAETLPTAPLRRRRFSPIWLVPIVAAVIAGWLGWKTLIERGPTVTITFESADGIEAGRTRVMHKNVALGVVEYVDLSHDLSHVIVRARMNRTAAPHLTTGTRFWVVRPRLTVGGISGLGTLVSGAYVEMEPGDGESASEFVGLADPPMIRITAPGRRFTLLANRLGSLNLGSPIYFRGVQVGQVEGYNLATDNKAVIVHVFVHAPNDLLVHDTTRFWNASGLQLSASASGFQVNTESLEALLAGGIVFDTMDKSSSDQASADGTAFKLYEDATSAQNDPYGPRLSYILQFPGSVRGLEVGAPVELEGIRVGRVSDIRLGGLDGAGPLRTPVTVEIEPERLGVPAETRSEDLQGVTDHMLDAMIEHGLRAQLRTGNLLTGQRLVSLDFVPDVHTASLVRGGVNPELPTVPSTNLDTLTESANQLLAKLAALPLPEFIDELRGTVRSVNQLVTSPEMARSLRSLDRALANTDRLTREADAQLGPLLRSLRESAGHADAVLASAGDMMTAGADIPKAVRELGNAARSLRVLSDYLEQHPEALLRGKAGATR
jgi:paraquat-inducible protein B